jgi:hypothetical protein
MSFWSRTTPQWDTWYDARRELRWHWEVSLKRRVAGGVTLAVMLALFAGAGYWIGTETGITQERAAQVEDFEYRHAFDAARRDAVARAEERGRAAGTKAGIRAAEQAGATAGARRGAAAATAEQAAIAAAAAAAAAEERAARRAARQAEAAAAIPEPAPSPAPTPVAPPPPAEPCFTPQGFPC